MHAAFQLSKIGGGRPPARPSTDVVLLGFGRVGRALAELMAETPKGHPVRIVGLLDRSGYVFDARGLSLARLRQLAQAKDAGGMLAAIGGTPATAADALAFMSSHAVSRPVLVDVTSDETSADAAGRARPRLQRGAGQQAAAGRVVGVLRAPADHRRRRRAHDSFRGHGRRRPAGDRHPQEAGRNRRPGAAHRRLRQRHADVRALGGVQRPAVLRGGDRRRAARLRRARSARRPVGAGRRPQGRDPGAAARLSRPGADARGPGAGGAQAAVPGRVHEAAAVARRRLEAPGRARSGARPGAALRGQRDADARFGEAGRCAGDQPDGLGRRRPQPRSPSPRRATVPSRWW